MVGGSAQAIYQRCGAKDVMPGFDGTHLALSQFSAALKSTPRAQGMAWSAADSGLPWAGEGTACAPLPWLPVT